MKASTLSKSSDALLSRQQVKSDARVAQKHADKRDRRGCLPSNSGAVAEVSIVVAVQPPEGVVMKRVSLSAWRCFTYRARHTL